MVNYLVNDLDDLWDISFSFSLPSLLLIKKRYWKVLILERRIIEICYWPFLILGKKRKTIAEGGKAGRASDKTAKPPLPPPPSCLDPPLKKVLLLPLRKVLLLNTILVFALVISQEPLVTPSLTIMAGHLLLRMKTTISIPMWTVLLSTMVDGGLRSVTALFWMVLTYMGLTLITAKALFGQVLKIIVIHWRALKWK